MSEKLCSDCPPVGYPTDKTRCVECPRRTPKALDAIADVVLRYRQKPKSEPAKERRRKKRRIERQTKKEKK